MAVSLVRFSVFLMLLFLFSFGCASGGDDDDGSHHRGARHDAQPARSCQGRRPRQAAGITAGDQVPGKIVAGIMGEGSINNLSTSE